MFQSFNKQQTYSLLSKTQVYSIFGLCFYSTKSPQQGFQDKDENRLNKLRAKNLVLTYPC